MECGGCDGWGIMTLTAGYREIKAPCLECSSDRRLEDLERERDEHIQKELESRH
jgi:hypothetical protein